MMYSVSQDTEQMPMARTPKVMTSGSTWGVTEPAIVKASRQ